MKIEKSRDGFTPNQKADRRNRKPIEEITKKSNVEESNAYSTPMIHQIYHEVHQKYCAPIQVHQK